MWPTTRLRDLFAKRFEADGDGYVYRANALAPGYRISRADRDRTVGEFSRRLRWLTWGMPILMSAILAGEFWFFIARSSDVPDAVIWATIVAWSGLYFISFIWLWNAPNQEFQGHMPAMGGRTKAEARQLAFQQLTWRRLGIATFGVAVLILRVHRNPFVGWNLLWLVLAGVLLMFVVVQAVRKWRFQRQK